MKAKFTITRWRDSSGNPAESAHLTLTREKGDKRYHGQGHAKGEHALLHNLKKFLNARGFELVKIRAQKDGHMIGDEFQPYLRPPKKRRDRGAPDIYIYWGNYALRDANEDWNNEGKVALIVELDCLDQQSDCIERIVKLSSSEIECDYKDATQD